MKNLTFLYEPAIEFIVNITKQGIKVDNPKTLKVGDKIDIENADHKPYGVSGSVTRKHENGYPYYYYNCKVNRKRVSYNACMKQKKIYKII